MPSRSELLSEIRKADPRAANVPDDELASALAKKYPKYADILSGSTFDKIPVSEKAKKNLASMQGGAGKAQFEQAQASADKDIKSLRLKAAGDVAAAIPFMAAAPVTGGMSLGAGAALMGGAGLIGGLARESITDEEISGPELVKRLGVDAATGMIGEGVGRGLGLVTKTILPKLILRATARAEGGKAVLDKIVYDTRRELEGEIEKYAMAGVPTAAPQTSTALVKSQARPAGQRMISGLRNVEAPVVNQTGTYWVDAGRPIKEAFDKITAQPQAAGKFGQRFSGMSPKAAEIVRDIEKDINVNNGSISNMQRLDHLVEVKGRLNQFAWEDEGLTRDEKVIFKNLAGDIDAVVKDGLKDVGAKAQALYKRANYIWKIQRETNVATKLAEKSITAWVRHKAIGAGIGGAYGYYAGGGIQGGLLGAGIGVGAEIAGPKLAKLAVEQVMAHPKGAVMMKDAVRFFIQGDKGKASALAMRALAVAGVRNTVRKAYEQADEELSAAPIAP